MFSDLRINKVFASRVKRFRNEYDLYNVFFKAFNIVIGLNIASIYKAFYVEIITIRYGCIVLRKDFEFVYDYVEELLKGVRFI